MTDRIKLLAGAAALALGLGSAGLHAQDWYQTWDSDEDGQLTPTEWTEGVGSEDIFGDFDVNGDGVLDRDEWGEDLVDLDGSVDDTFDMDEDQFAESTFDAYDSDDDGILDDEEFGVAGDQFGLFDDEM